MDYKSYGYISIFILVEFPSILRLHISLLLTTTFSVCTTLISARISGLSPYVYLKSLAGDDKQTISEISCNVFTWIA